MDSEPKSEREVYIENLQKKISNAVKKNRFNETDEGKMFREIITEQINLIVKNIGGRKYINDHNSYVFDTGQMFMAQKLLNLLNPEDTTQDTEKLKAAKSDG